MKNSELLLAASVPLIWGFVDYHRKEAFENHTARIEAHRKESSEELGITLIDKHDGVVRAEGSN